ncbi:acyl-CoA dehydrogenase family protein [Paraburkholderia caballeronis]|uniref:acyl-CoA dehydrogenase family protein n=1 Tax=Paraburkholderia caballeronis TaxID=416943 RepID=UPI0010651838|nr:acyl-CoA dehydrogenase family protein [Paraburkholderia caballeronis]TDV11387.1 acyl-CoA dehydrogenase [Paraburkholderia caballeronis]TDV14577.1 acyl-CoA dehydrogenase [Paraburkholderia caballeronis]TDV23648.1 acyl-CoA dehydrogenase [Paraburkholderia caballeronis]
MSADFPLDPHDALAWPFFEDRHRALAAGIEAWAREHLAHDAHPATRDEVDDACRGLVRALGDAGWLRYGVGGIAYGGHGDTIDTRAVCVLRETLAKHSGLADFALAMQGLGSGAISLAGTDAQKARYLPRVANGTALAAFALSEPNAGSDVAAMALSARVDGDDYVLDGEKTWISNGGIADFYVVFARTGEAPGARGITAFVVDAATPGLEIAERIDVIAPHPLARLRFAGARVPASQRLGAPGEGFKIAMRTLDIFRTSVAAASLGFARRAMAEGLARAASRTMFGQTLGDFQLTQAKLAQMALTIDSSALLVYRAAWLRDRGESVTREAAMAKWHASEGAQQVIDAAVQLWGGMGVQSGTAVETLYREIRALRIYEGATEVQQLIVGRDVLKTHAASA